MRLIILISLIAVSACHRATAAEIGTANRRDAFPVAIMTASTRAHEASPAVVAQSATGTPMRQAPVTN